MELSDWDTIWKWDLFLRPDHDSCRPGRSRLYKASLQMAQGSVLSVLDASCGRGDSLLLLREAGVDADGCDGSSVAVELAREALRQRGHDGSSVFRAEWHELPEVAPRRYDLIISDALSWICGEREFESALQGLFAALRPAGRLIFSGATDEHPKRGMACAFLKLIGSASEPLHANFGLANDQGILRWHS